MTEFDNTTVSDSEEEGSALGTTLDDMDSDEEVIS